MYSGYFIRITPSLGSHYSNVLISNFSYWLSLVTFSFFFECLEKYIIIVIIIYYAFIKSIHGLAPIGYKTCHLIIHKYSG
jgi:hypothetical protein